MGGYLVNFSVYTFAMVGFLFLAVIVYKKTNAGIKKSKNNGNMQIEESLNLTPRKSLHVVSVGSEKFLIAADIERTEFLAKLESDETILSGVKFNPVNEKIQLVSKKNSNVTPITKMKDVEIVQGNVALKKSAIQCGSTRLSQVKNIDMKKKPFMREILRKLEVQNG